MGQHRSRSRRRGHASRANDQSAFLSNLLGESTSRGRSARADQKTAMLCRQVQRALTLALGACGDDVLTSCYVDAVEPAPDASHLLVKLVAPPDASMPDLLQRLDRVSGTLRYEVAQSVSRKRVPSLSWLPVLTPSPGTPGEGNAGGAR
jgi:ribosome-binding factor A